MDNNAWLVELNTKTCSEWKTFAVHLGIEEVEQRKFIQGEEIYEIYYWAKAHGKEDSFRDAIATYRNDVLHIIPQPPKYAASIEKNKDVTNEKQVGQDCQMVPSEVKSSEQSNTALEIKFARTHDDEVIFDSSTKYR